MRLRRLRSALRDERGFSLVEMLVSAVAGVLVLGVTLTVLDMSVHQSARATDRVEASQRGRIAMEQMIQLLHSSCVAASVSPVQTGSDSTHLQFLSQFGSAVVLTPNLHKIAFTGGSLTDSVYAATGGSAPLWTFGATPTSTNTFISNVGQASVNGSTQPVFQYFKYVNGTMSLAALPTPLSASDAATTAQVTITFAAAPTSASPEADRTINLSDSAVLRYVPASADTTIVNWPCQ